MTTVLAALHGFEPLLNLLYTASAVALAVAAAIGLRQLKIAKDTAKMAAKRGLSACGGPVRVLCREGDPSN
jgi:hypothetical protein